jgi:transposase
MEPPRHLAGHVQGDHRQHRRDRHCLNRQFARQGAPLGGRRRRRGAFKEGVGRSRGGRTTAIHALTDGAGKPRVLLVAQGNLHDVMMAEELLSAAGPVERLIADKAYDTNRLRTVLQQRGIEAVIPSSGRRKPLIPYDRAAYRQRNLIERMFARLKDFRRVATRYDKLARNYLSGIILAAATIRWT